MEYGSRIRETRISLGLTLMDLKDSNISHNMVSHIETGASNLVPSKALMLYKKLIEEGMRQNKCLDLEFDSILSSNESYLNYKNAKEIICKLRNSIDESASLDIEELKQHVAFAKRNDIGILSYYIFLYCARLIDSSNNQLRIETYYSALDYLRWYKENKRNIKLFEDTLFEVTPDAYSMMDFEVLIKYYEHYVTTSEHYAYYVRSSTYFNLGLMYKKIENFPQSTKYIDKYLNLDTLPNKEDPLDAMILKANVFIDSGNIIEGIRLYNEILQNDLNDIAKSICLSNLVFNIANSEIDINSNDYLSKLVELENIYKNAETEKSFKYQSPLSLATGYEYLGYITNALKYYEEAFRLATFDSEKVNVLNRSYSSYISSGNIYEYVNHLVTVDLSKLELNEFKLILKLIFRISDMKEIVTKTEFPEFYEYINSLRDA